jgi:predicted 2-oxoglutarate/Fe(II)-dependent dioxygenase YbiX
MTSAYLDFPAPILIIDEFLSSQDSADCLRECIDLEQSYVPASVGHGAERRQDPTIRQNKVVKMDEVFGVDRSRSKILTALDSRTNDHDCMQLWNAGYHIFNIVSCANSTETILSRYGHCDFYGKHRDTLFNNANQDAVRRRLVTICYYMNTQPERFEGGEIKFYEDGKEVAIHPIHNRAVVFPSSIVHSVANVRLADSEPFSSGRFSINRWVGFK